MRLKYFVVRSILLCLVRKNKQAIIFANISILGHKSRRGSLLIVALWVLVFLSIVAVLTGSMVRQQITALERIETRSRLRAMAESCAHRVVAIICSTNTEIKDSSPTADCLNDYWANNPQQFKKVECGNGACSVKYSYVDYLTGNQATTYGLMDEERKVSINHASIDTLQRLFIVAAQLDNEKALLLAQSVIDWRDQDDIFHGSEPASSEYTLYMNSGSGYGPTNSFFSSPEELLLVRGMDSKIFSRIRDYITVFTDGAINLNTAPAQVILSLGLSDIFVDTLLHFRSGPNMVEGDSDDHMFSSVDTILPILTHSFQVAETDKVLLSNLISSGALGVSSAVFSAYCFSQLENTAMYGTILCVFERESGRTHYWGFSYTGWQEP